MCLCWLIFYYWSECSVLKEVECGFFKDSFIAVDMFLNFCECSLHPWTQENFQVAEQNKILLPICALSIFYFSLISSAMQWKFSQLHCHYLKEITIGVIGFLCEQCLILVLFLILGFSFLPSPSLPTPSINIILLKILRCQAAKVESAIAEGGASRFR